MVDAPSSITRWDTGCPTDLLMFVGSKSVQYPERLVSVPSVYVYGDFPDLCVRV